MFGPDTHLIFGAMQMAAVVAGVTGGGVFLLMRWRRKKTPDTGSQPPQPEKADLEERVRVLERIATDPATRLAEEFDQLEKGETTGRERV